METLTNIMELLGGVGPEYDELCAARDAEIRRLIRDEDQSQTAIAQLTGLSRQRISQIAANK